MKVATGNEPEKTLLLGQFSMLPNWEFRLMLPMPVVFGRPHPAKE
jgi:hypothetical protein